MLAFVKVETIISTYRTNAYLWGMEKNKEMKQPIETLLTELTVLEEQLNDTFKEYKEAEKVFMASIEKTFEKRVTLRQKLKTLKTQIAQANENR